MQSVVGLRTAMATFRLYSSTPANESISSTGPPHAHASTLEIGTATITESSWLRGQFRRPVEGIPGG